MTEVPDNAESPLEGEVEPWAQEPGEGPARPPDRPGYIAQLQALPVWPELVNRLAAGDSARSIALWLVNERGFACDNVRSLAEMLNRYRHRQMPQAMVTPPPALPSLPGQDGAPPRTGESLLREIQWAIRQQVARIRKARKTEKGFPMSHPQVTQDLELLRRLAETQATLAMRLGLAKEAPQQLNVASLGMYADLATLPPDAQGRVLDMAAYILRQAGVAHLPKAGDGDGHGDGHGGDGT